MRSPRDFFKPLALGAPDAAARDAAQAVALHPLLRRRATRRWRRRCPRWRARPTSCSATSKTRFPADKKVAAREGLVQVGREVDLGDTPLWTRVNSLDSPWFLDDITQLVGEIGDRSR